MNKTALLISVLCLFLFSPPAHDGWSAEQDPGLNGLEDTDQFKELEKTLKELGEEMKRSGEEIRGKIQKEVIPRIQEELEALKDWIRKHRRKKEKPPPVPIELPGTIAL